MAASAETVSDQASVYQQLDAYFWNEDHEFQGGLDAILGSIQNPEQVEHLTLLAKCYYFERKAGTNVDFDGYKRWTEEHKSAVAAEPVPVAAVNGTSTGVVPEAPKPASFAQIVDLITEGKPIPGIKDIPDTILEGQSSESQAEKRRKPWERRATTTEQPSWMTRRLGQAGGLGSCS